jgi:adenylate cyclase
MPASPSIDVLPQSRGISIVVLPFVNMSCEPEYGFLADGLTEDLTTELSRLKDFLVIASKTAFTYKDRAVDVAQVGRDLGVRYVLEGSMRYLGSRLRITAQLIDVRTGTHLWAEKFDRERSELFDIQDEVVRAVAASTQTQLMIREGETRFGETNEDCWALTMQAGAENYKMTTESLAKSEQICRRLTLEYPQWARGHTLLSSNIYHQIIMGFEPANSERKEEALREARQGVALDPKDEFNLLNLAMPLMDFAGDADEVMVLLHRVLEINPNFSLGYGLLGDNHLALGQPDEAIRNAEIAIRLNPRDPSIFYRYETLAKANFQKGDDNKALHWASQMTALKPDYWSGYAIATAILAGRSNLDQARRSAEALKKCWPGVSISAIKAIEAWNNAPWRQLYFRNLLAAGIPE